MGEGRRPDSGGKEHLGQGGRAPRLKGGVLAAGLLLATGALAATTASSTSGASRAAGGIALSASKPSGRADAGAQAAAGKVVAGQGPQRLTGGAIPLTALKGVAAPREGIQVAAATRSATGTVSAAGLAGATQVALLDWPRTDTGGRAPISGEAMTALAVQQLLRAGIAEADFGMAIVPLKGAGASPVPPAGASWTPAAPIEHRTTGDVMTGEADGMSADRASDEPMLRVMHQAERPFNPASTMKLVTTHAALAMLGPDYRWTTRFLTTGPIRDGVLQGDLILQGGGDPHLVIEDLHALMADLRAQGLKTIRGDLVVDDARFAVGPADGEAFDGDASQAYNVRPWAALTNFKASKLVIDPKKRQLALEPPLADVQLRYDVKVLKGRCRTALGRAGRCDGCRAPGGVGERHSGARLWVAAVLCGHAGSPAVPARHLQGGLEGHGREVPRAHTYPAGRGGARTTTLCLAVHAGPGRGGASHQQVQQQRDDADAAAGNGGGQRAGRTGTGSCRPVAAPVVSQPGAGAAVAGDGKRLRPVTAGAHLGR